MLTYPGFEQREWVGWRDSLTLVSNSVNGWGGEIHLPGFEQREWVGWRDSLTLVSEGVRAVERRLTYPGFGQRERGGEVHLPWFRTV